MKQRVLFLCTHNSSRSQMAEALLRHDSGERFETFSAGTEVTRVHPRAIEAMEELGVDMSSHRSKHVDELRGETFDLVITVCDAANETCPVFPANTKRLHWSFPDPSKSGTLEEYRKVRDAIRERLREL
ncbi:MAG TPA: arsenate reductase ArsC [Thermoanaerobaculia bacterium]|nr:arsenate reductase ArsC [Thermoanaerobaculia bacterium]